MRFRKPWQLLEEIWKQKREPKNHLEFLTLVSFFLKPSFVVLTFQNCCSKNKLENLKKMNSVKCCNRLSAKNNEISVTIVLIMRSLRIVLCSSFYFRIFRIFNWKTKLSCLQALVIANWFKLFTYVQSRFLKYFQISCQVPDADKIVFFQKYSTLKEKAFERQTGSCSKNISANKHVTVDFYRLLTFVRNTHTVNTLFKV